MALSVLNAHLSIEPLHSPALIGSMHTPKTTKTHRKTRLRLNKTKTKTDF